MPMAASQLNCLDNVLRELSKFRILDCCLLLLLKLLRWGRLLCIQPCLVLLGIPKNLMSPHWHLGAQCVYQSLITASSGMNMDPCESSYLTLIAFELPFSGLSLPVSVLLQS